MQSIKDTESDSRAFKIVHLQSHMQRATVDQDGRIEQDAAVPWRAGIKRNSAKGAPQSDRSASMILSIAHATVERHDKTSLKQAGDKCVIQLENMFVVDRSHKSTAIVITIGHFKDALRKSVGDRHALPAQLYFANMRLRFMHPTNPRQFAG